MGRFTEQIQTLKSSQKSASDAINAKLSGGGETYKLSELPAKIREIETAKPGALDLTIQTNATTLTCDLGFKTMELKPLNGSIHELIDQVPSGTLKLTIGAPTKPEGNLFVDRTINNNEVRIEGNDDGKSFTDTLEIKPEETFTVLYEVYWMTR